MNAGNMVTGPLPEKNGRNCRNWLFTEKRNMARGCRGDTCLQGGDMEFIGTVSQEKQGKDRERWREHRQK